MNLLAELSYWTKAIKSESSKWRSFCEMDGQHGHREKRSDSAGEGAFIVVFSGFPGKIGRIKRPSA